MRNHRRIALGAALLPLAVLAAACGSGGGGNSNTPSSTSIGQGKAITVGVSGDFAESKILAEMYGQVLANAGFNVKYQLSLDSRKASDPALFSGSIDLKPEYLASESTAQDPNAATSGDPNNNAHILSGLLSSKGVTVLNYSPAVDENVFVVTKETASQNSLTNLSDLAKPAPSGSGTLASTFVFGAPPDCPTNKFCQIGLKDLYGIEFKEVKPLDFGGPATVQALKSGAVQVGELFSTSIYDPDFQTLVDDKHLEASDNIVPVIRKEFATPGVEQLLNAVSAKLTTEAMNALNKQVDVNAANPAAVAKTFLQANGLLPK